MNKATYSLLVVIPLVLILAGVAGLVPDSLSELRVGGIPAPIILILGLLAWLVIVACLFLRDENQDVDD